MRLNINLASQPYEDAKRFIAIWASVVGALLLLLIALSIGVYKHWRDYRQMSGNIARERLVLQDFEQKQQQGLAILNQPDNRDVREKSESLNTLIRRKQVSWTKIFTDLEQLMPAHLRVLAIEPRIAEDKIMVQMELGGDSRDRVAQLVRHMEKSNVFRDAIVRVESDGTPGAGQTDIMRAQVTAEYVPGESLTPPESQKSSPEGGQ